MAKWNPLRDKLAAAKDRVTLSWAELDQLVGGLPASAYRHSAFWKGARTGWPGFTAEDVRIGEQVTFVPRTSSDSATASRVRTPAVSRNNIPDQADVVLVGCVKKKRDHPTAAKDLYISTLFRKERAYAEGTRSPWFILSAQYGLVAPEEILEPYDLRMSKTSRQFRREWGARVVEQLWSTVGPLAGLLIEIHAGAAYADEIRERLIEDGARVVEPLRGLTMGERLRWYDTATLVPPAPSPSQEPAPEVSELLDRLDDVDDAITPSAFLATDGAGLRAPGLYSWWVDADGAATLTTGLGHVVDPGLIYAGLAGATRSRSGRKSKNTLWGRIRGMHLGGRHEFSTFRLSLGSILAHARGESEIDEDTLTTWMHAHLRVIAIPVDDADILNRLETAVLAELDPPLNLDKMQRTPIRERLTELRRQFAHRSHR